MTILEHSKSNSRSAKESLIWGLAITIVLAGFGFFITDGPLVIPWIVFVVVIILPVTMLTAVQHFKKPGSFRSWLTEEKIGQEIPIPYNGVKSFEVDIDQISGLKKFVSNNDAPTRWIIKLNDGRLFELCDHYGNPVHRYFKHLTELRSDLVVEG